MATDPNIHPHWAADAKALAVSILGLDYYEILGCSQNASIAEIKQRYHALQREFHPDTFYQSPDEELREAVFLIAKRVAEAYVVLRDEEKRQKYLQDVTGPDRARRLRFTDETEQEVRREKQKARDEVLGKTPQGRQLVQKALTALRASDLQGARRDLKMALVFEKDNDSVKKRLEEVEEQLKASREKK